MSNSREKTNNPDGRPAGSQNKCTAEIRQMITNFLSDNFAIVVNDFNRLEPRDRIKLYIQLMAFCVSRL